MHLSPTRGQMLALVRDGRMTPNEFFQKTRSHWERAAAYLLRRWRAPTWFEPGEVSQEVMVGAWLAIWKYEADRGKTIEQYVDWNAIDYAKKKLHKARGAGLHGSPDRRPSRFEIPISSLVDADGDVEWVERITSIDPFEVEVIDVRRKLEKVKGTESEKIVARMLVAAGNDAVEVAEAVCHDDALCRRLRVKDVTAVAKRVVEIQERLEGGV